MCIIMIFWYVKTGQNRPQCVTYRWWIELSDLPFYFISNRCHERTTTCLVFPRFRIACTIWKQYPSAGFISLSNLNECEWELRVKCTHSEVLFGNFFGLSVSYEGPPTRGFVPTVGSLRDGSTKYDTYLFVCVCVCVCVWERERER
jgi:hypothetical protein